jgi:hypothetical protein
MRWCQRKLRGRRRSAELAELIAQNSRAIMNEEVMVEARESRPGMFLGAEARPLGAGPTDFFVALSQEQLPTFALWNPKRRSTQRSAAAQSRGSAEAEGTNHR